MVKSLDTLANSLGLSPGQTAALKATLGQQAQTAAFLQGKSISDSAATLLTCSAARVILGPEAVDTPPIVQNEVDVNWCIPLLASEQRKSQH